MNYNAIIKVSDTTDESGATAEPVTIQEFKNYMRLEGFVDDDASTTEALSDFDFDDTLIAELLIMGRRIVEKSRDVNLRVKTLTVKVTNLCGWLKIPGPVNSLPTVTDNNGTALTGVEMSGDYLLTPLQKNITLTYSAGYQYPPKRYLIEVMRIAAFFYVNRGEDDRNKFLASLPAKILV